MVYCTSIDMLETDDIKYLQLNHPFHSVVNMYLPISHDTSPQPPLS